MEKAEFYWAIIGDANPEPVAITEENGKRVAYTIGCPDPFDLDSGNIELMEDGAMYGGGVWKQERLRLDPPKKVRAADHVKRREEAEARLARDRKRGVVHGWKRWNP